MLLSYLYPFPIRGLEAPLLWVFYRQLAAFWGRDVAYIGSPEYFQDPRRLETTRSWEAHPATQSRFGFAFPPADALIAARKHLVDAEIFDPLLAETTSGLRAWAALMTRPYPPLVERLTEIFHRVRRESTIDAVVTFNNCGSLRKVAKKFGVPMIHNELGGLRPPLFASTFYFDFQGVNGNTEAADRYCQFQREAVRTRAPMLMIDDLYELVGGATPLALPPTEMADWMGQCEFDLGLPLQVEDDSNLIAFGNGYSNFELIHTALQFTAPEKLLVRQHPGGSLDYRRTAWKPINVDQSPTSLDFIRRCRRIATINSSVALESLLLGRPTCILGDSPFRFIAGGSLSELFQQPAGWTPERVVQLNFALLGYLMPEAMVFDEDYYLWRLGRPSELEIYRTHLDYYRAQQARNQQDPPPVSAGPATPTGQAA